jgi:GntP family gluconate:H+ symporter
MPLAVPVVLILSGLAFPALRFLADPSPALLAGLAVALVAAPAGIRAPAAARGARHAGIIIFDLCGAGALAGIIAGSEFSAQLYQALGTGIPSVIIPFALAGLLMAALGSRVATAVVAGALLSESPLAGQVHPFVMILLIGAGILSFNYVTDPYFWLVKRVTGDDTATVVRNYTMPLALCGIMVLALALILHGYVLFQA